MATNTSSVDSSYSVSELAKQIDLHTVTSDRQSMVVRRDVLAEHCASMHRRLGTLTPGVGSALDRLRGGAAIVRFAHQPNFMPYMNIVGHALYLSALADELSRESRPTVAIYLVVDHDDAEDRRFRLSQLPDPLSDTGTKPLTLPLSRKDRGRVKWSLLRPNQEFDDSCERTWRSYINRTEMQLAPSGVRLAALGSALSWNDMIPSSSYGESLVDYNMRPLAQLLNVNLSIPILFLSLRQITTDLEPAYAYILHEWNAKIGFDRDILPLWYICPKCFYRHEINISSGKVNLQCFQCKLHEQIPLSLFLSSPITLSHGQVAPRVLFDDLLDYIGLGVSGGSAYASSREHIDHAHQVALRLGLAPPPDSIWRLRLLHAGPAEVLAHWQSANTLLPSSHLDHAVETTVTGRAGLPYYLGLPRFVSATTTAMYNAFTMQEPHLSIPIYLPSEWLKYGAQDEVIQFVAELIAEEHNDG